MLTWHQVLSILALLAERMTLPLGEITEMEFSISACMKYDKNEHGYLLTKSTRTYALKSHPDHTYFLGRPYSWAAMFHVPRPHRLPVWNYLWSHARKEASPHYSQTSFFTSLLPRGHPKLHHSFYLDLSSNALWLLEKIIPQKRNLPLKDKDQQH